MNTTRFLNYYNFLDKHTLKNNNILKNIFLDNWKNFYIAHKNIRKVCFKTIDKFLNCGNPNNGFALYECPDCKNFLRVPFTCKSRFCPSCGVNKSLDYSKKLQNRCLNVSHRHIIWTIPDTLRNVFRKYRKALDLLFLASKITIFSIFKNKLKPEIISTLHTFRRDLKWNPHVHILITEGGFGLNKNYLELKHFSYTKLRKTFMTILLKLLYKNKYISLNEKQIQYILYKNGYYIYASKTAFFNTSQKLLNYITRYISRPVIATSRILNYDGEKVTYFFERHEDNKKITVTENALYFIGKLIIHIPNEYKNLIRYYGI